MQIGVSSGYLAEFQRFQVASHALLYLVLLFLTYWRTVSIYYKLFPRSFLYLLNTTRLII
jgi:hypothetical protein